MGETFEINERAVLKPFSERDCIPPHNLTQYVGEIVRVDSGLYRICPCPWCLNHLGYDVVVEADGRTLWVVPELLRKLPKDPDPDDAIVIDQPLEIA
jgi:hypothetical protein